MTDQPRDIPENRDTEFPQWVTDNFQPGQETVTLNTPSGRHETAGRTDLPTNFADRLMPMVGITVPQVLFTELGVKKVVVNGSEYAEQIFANVAAGAEVEVNAGQRPVLTENNNPNNFLAALPDDVIFSTIQAGGKLKANLDQTANKELVFNDQATGKAMQLGGFNALIVTGEGEVEAKGGEFGDLFVVEAKTSTTDMGDGDNFYRLNGSAETTAVTGGKHQDTFEVNFTGGVLEQFGTVNFEAGEGATEANKTDNVQVRGLPNGAKVIVEITAVNGSVNDTFRDTNSIITIQDANGTQIGQIKANNNNYIFLLNADGSTTNIDPARMLDGFPGTKEFVIGQDAAAERAAPKSKSEKSVAEDKIPTNSPVTPQELESLIAQSQEAAQKG